MSVKPPVWATDSLAEDLVTAVVDVRETEM
jgi:hypothetical protein